MKSRFAILIAALASGFLYSCMDFRADPYGGQLNNVVLRLVYPAGYEDCIREGIGIVAEDVNTGSRYAYTSDATGRTEARLPDGIYRFSASDRNGADIFNTTLDHVLVSDSDLEVTLNFIHTETGSLLIKEVYSGGCSMAPLEGTYQSDKYLILHNNIDRTIYLDSLCLGTIAPYNSSGNNPWTDEAERFSLVRIVQALWQFGGDGDDFPLLSGEDAIICLNGAIDHTIQYPLSVNLNRKDCFVCYNTTYFPNPFYHPAPGPLIRPERILNVVIKTGQANAFTVSLSSPVLVIFKAKGTTIQDFVRIPENVVQIPGSTADRVVCIPPEWILDGVEIFDGRSSSNTKRLSPRIDAGHATLSDIFQGHALSRKIDRESSEKYNYEILQDTNNSTNDFYERDTQSLHD